MREQLQQCIEHHPQSLFGCWLRCPSLQPCCVPSIPAAQCRDGAGAGGVSAVACGWTNCSSLIHSSSIPVLGWLRQCQHFFYKLQFPRAHCLFLGWGIYWLQEPKIRVLFSEQIVIANIIFLSIQIEAINLLRIVNKDCISLTLVFCLMPDFTACLMIHSSSWDLWGEGWN